MGTLVLLSAGLAGTLVALSILATGMTEDAYLQRLTTDLETAIKAEPRFAEIFRTPANTEQLKAYIKFFVRITPMVTAAVWTAIMVANIWIATKVLKMSERDTRPWAPFPEIALPRLASLALAGSILGAALPGTLGFIAEAYAASLLCAFAILGMAVLHCLTRGFSRPRVRTGNRLFLIVHVQLAGGCPVRHAWHRRAGLRPARPPKRHRIGRHPDIDLQHSNHRQDTGVRNMEVVLLERIERLGQMGDVVRVKDGYARNFLLPQKKALRATKANMERFETERAQLEAVNLERKTEAEAVSEKVDGESFVILRQAGEAGQLYGSVTTPRYRRTGHRRRHDDYPEPGHPGHADQNRRPARSARFAAPGSHHFRDHQCGAHRRRSRTAGAR